jgi:hypothetical protein
MQLRYAIAWTFLQAERLKASRNKPQHAAISIGEVPHPVFGQEQGLQG